MTLVASSLQSLIDGVSQQPDVLRLKSQGETQVNGLSSEVDGLIKRPPLELLADLEDATEWADSYQFLIERDDQHKFIAMIRSDDANGDPSFAAADRGDVIRVYDLEGNRMPLSYQSADEVELVAWDSSGTPTVPAADVFLTESYLGTETGVIASIRKTGLTTKNTDRFRHQTIADYTFITNRERIPQVDDVLLDYNGVPEDAGAVTGIIYIKQSFLGQEYGVSVVDDAGTVLEFSHTTSDTNQESTTDIVTALEVGIQAEPNYATLNYTVEAHKDLLLIKRKAAAADSPTALAEWTAMQLDFNSPVGAAGGAGIKGEVAKLADLPHRAPANYVVKIAGLDRSTSNDYYVRFDPDHDGTNPDLPVSTGTWKETVGFTQHNSFHNHTLPHALIYDKPNDAFIFRPIAWEDRLVGDDDSVPTPSFASSFLVGNAASTGSPVMDLTFHRSRLGFITSENIVLSEAGSYFNFWASTATEVLDSDPIDISASHHKIVNLHSALTYNKTLLLFSEKAQFRLEGGDTLTPLSVSLVPSTEYENPNLVKPVQAGSTILYPTQRGRWSGMNEMFVSAEGSSDLVADISNQVPRYIDGAITFMDSSPKETLMACIADNTDAIYIYKYYYSGTEKLQSSWSLWDLPVSPKAALFVDSTIKVTAVEGDRLKLYSIGLERQRTEDGLDYLALLDSRQLLTGIFDGNFTTWTTDFDTGLGDVAVINTDAAHLDGGYEVSGLEIVDANTVRALGQHDATPYVVGIRYDFRYRFSKLYVRDQNDTPITTGRLQLRRGNIVHGASGYFALEVDNGYDDTVTVEYTGRVVDDPFPDEVSIREGTFSFPLIGRSDLADISVVSDSHLPVSILELEWEGFHHRRNRRV